MRNEVAQKKNQEKRNEAEETQLQQSVSQSPKQLIDHLQRLESMGG